MNSFKGLLASALLLVGATTANANSIRAHGPEPGGGSYVAIVALGTMAEKHADASFQLQAGQTATRSMVALSNGKIDLSLLPVPAVNFFKQGKAMYKNLEQAPELSKNLRGILVWECCAWHFMTYDDQGINSMEGFAGKKIYTGPPGSVAKRNLEAMIKAATGFVAGEDYTPVNLDWGAGAQAFRDRNIDVHIQASQIGGTSIEQLSVSRDVRLIGFPSTEDNEALKKATSLPGNQLVNIPPGVYSGVVNAEPVSAVALRHIAGVGVHSDEDFVYEWTKSIWENIEEFYSYGDFLRKVNPDLAFKDMNVPLHAGAYRYYKEAGWEVPSNLIPPEAQ